MSNLLTLPPKNYVLLLGFGNVNPQGFVLGFCRTLQIYGLYLFKTSSSFFQTLEEACKHKQTPTHYHLSNHIQTATYNPCIVIYLQQS